MRTVQTWCARVWRLCAVKGKCAAEVVGHLVLRTRLGKSEWRPSCDAGRSYSAHVVNHSTAKMVHACQRTHFEWRPSCAAGPNFFARIRRRAGKMVTSLLTFYAARTQRLRYARFSEFRGSRIRREGYAARRACVPGAYCVRVAYCVLRPFGERAWLDRLIKRNI